MNAANGPAKSDAPVFDRKRRSVSPGRFFRFFQTFFFEESRSPTVRRAGAIFPMAAVFVAAAFGILFDASVRPGDRIWFIALPVFAACWLSCMMTFKRRRDLPRSGKPDSGRMALRRFASIFLLLFLAAAFGLEHRLMDGRFAPDELGLLIPEAGSPAILEFWVDEMPEVIPAPLDTGSIITPSDRTCFRACAVRIKNKNVWQTVSGRVETALSGDFSHLRIGDRVRAGGVLYYPSGKKNPGDRDWAAALRRERTLLCFSVSDTVAVQVVQTKERFAVRRFFEQIRRRCHAAFERSLDPENGRLASAMVLGIKSGIDEETRRLFRDTGTAHLLAISGLHIGLVTGFFYWFLRFLGVPYRLTAVATAAVAIGYLTLTDMRPPAIRATTLTVILCGAVLFRRRAFSINSLALAAVLLLAIHPSQLFDVGAHLSFLATGVFLWFPKQDPEKPTGKISLFFAMKLRSMARSKPVRAFLLRLGLQKARLLLQFTVISLVIWLVLLPLILNRLNILSPVGLALNPFLWLPVMISLVSSLLLLMVAGLGSVFGMAFGTLTAWSASCADFGYHLLNVMLTTAQSVRGSHWMIPGPAVWWCLGFYVPLILWTLFPAIRPKRRAIFALVTLWVIIGFSASALHYLADRLSDRVRIDVLSVGHGGATLIRFPDRRTVLYDCGSFGSPELAARRVSGALFAHGGVKIDLVILSHADADHYNGLTELLDTVPVRAIAVSPMMFEKKTDAVARLARTLEARKIPIHVFSTGQTLERAGFPELTVYHPARKKGEDGESNANSLVVGLVHHGRGVLLPGDLDSKQADFLHAPPKRFDLILAPHHGGKSENYRDLLNWATPKIIVICGGNFQRNIDSEKALQREGFRVLNTFDSGAVQMEITRPKPGETLGEFRFEPMIP